MSANAQPILHAERLAYGTPTGRTLQENLNFTLMPGQLFMITGANGTGKSTLLKTVLGEVRPQRGTVSFNVADREIEYIPQLENTEIHLPLTLKDVLSISSRDSLSTRAVEKFGLLSVTQLERAWNTASGGERKRTLLTRAMLRDPNLLVLDEPMNHLDTLSRRAMVRVMAHFLSKKEQRRAIIMVCHQGLEEFERSQFDVVHVNLGAEA